MSIAGDLLETIKVSECKNYGKTYTSEDGKVKGKVKDFKDGTYTIETDSGTVEVPETGGSVA